MRQKKELGPAGQAFSFLLTIILIGYLVYFSFISAFLLVLHVVILMLLLLESIRKDFATEFSQRDAIQIYGGAAAIFASLLFLTFWMGYCEYANYPYGCQYPRYVLPLEVILIHVSLFPHREKINRSWHEIRDRIINSIKNWILRRISTLK